MTEPSLLSVIWGLFKIFIGLGIVIALAILSTRFLTRRLPAGQHRGGVRLLGHIYLGGRRGVSFLQVGRRVLILGVTDHQVGLLETVSDPAEVAALEEGAAPPPILSNPQWDKVRDRLDSFSRILQDKLSRSEGSGRRRDPRDE